MFVIRFPLGVITVADPGFTNGEQGRGAAGAERSGVWGGEDPSPLRRAWGEGDAPPPKKKIDFGSQSGDFRCILCTIFTVHLFGLNAKGSALGSCILRPRSSKKLELDTGARDQNKTRTTGLPGQERCLTICSAVWIQSANVT